MDEFERGLNTAKEKFDGFSDKLAKAGETISNVGGTLTKGITLPLAGLGTAVIKTGMDYEAGMSKVQAISGATGDEMTALGEKAMEMAAKTKFSTADSAEAYQYMAMAGWKAGDMVDGLAGIMNLAAASGENLGTTSDIVTDALTAFGLKAGDSGRFADVLAAASNNANTNVSMLGESFKYVAPVAGAMGYSVEDVSVALGLMANSGIKASQAGTSLRTAITNMASPTKNMAAVMEEYGITLTDANGNMLSLSDVMGQLREKMGGLDESAQASAASMLFGKEAMSGMLAIINAAPADFDKLTEAINNSSGTTEELASIMQNNAAGAFERLKSAIDVLFTQLSSILLPIFTQVVDKVTEWVNWFGSLDEGTQRLILTIAGIAAAVGPVLIVIGKIITALTAIGGAISSVVGFVTSGISSILSIGGTLMGGIKALFALLMAHPVIAAITAIIAAIVLLWQNCEEFRDFVKGMVEAIVGFFKDLASGISSALSGIAEFIGGVFSKAWELVQAAWGAAVDFFSAIWSGIETVFSVVAEVLGGFFSAAWDAVKVVWDTVVGVFQGIADGIHAAFEAVTSFLGDAFSAAWDLISGVWGAAVDFFSGVWDGITGIFGAVADWFGDMFSKAWEAVRSAWNGVSDFFGGVWEKITGVFSNVWEKFKEIGGNIVKGIKDGVANAWDSFWRWLSGKVGGIVDGVKGLLGIHSPSTVFAGIGGNMALGLAEGWNDEYGSIKRKIEEGMHFGTASIGLSARGAGSWPGNGAPGGNPPVSRGGDTFNFYSPKQLDPVSAAREMKKAKQQMTLAYVGG